MVAGHSFWAEHREAGCQAAWVGRKGGPLPSSKAALHFLVHVCSNSGIGPVVTVRNLNTVTRMKTLL